MTLTLAERLILLGQVHILKQLQGKGELDADDLNRARDILADGRSSYYSQVFGHLSEQECDSAADGLVSRILTMYRALSRAGIVEGDGSYAVFRGFDGNTESAHHSALSFHVKSMRHFEEQRDASFNSHHPTLDAYGRMLARWKSFAESYKLSREDALNIVAAAER